MAEKVQPVYEEHLDTGKKGIGYVYPIAGGVGAIVVVAAIIASLEGIAVEGIGVTQVVLGNLAILLAATIGGLSGFGLAQVANGVLPLFMPAAAASIIFTPLAILASGTTFLSVRHNFQFRDYMFPAMGLLPALPIGAYFFSQWDNAQVKTAIGVVLLFAVAAIALFRQSTAVKEWVKRSGFEPGWKLGILAGAFAGFLGGAVGIPGPPMIVYGSILMAIGVWAPSRTKAVFTSVFCTILTYRLITLIVLGKVTIPLMTVSALLLPGMVIGVLTGIALFNRLASNTFNWIVLGLLTANAILLLTTGQG